MRITLNSCSCYTTCYTTGLITDDVPDGPLNTSFTRDNSHFPPPTADDLEIEAEIARKVLLLLCLCTKQFF
jgi:hypothetical protein